MVGDLGVSRAQIRAMVVDDEPILVQALAQTLAREPDIEVIAECLSGPEAIAGIRKLRPDLVFLDIRMPGLDGFEVLEELEDVERPLVIFVTAYDQHALQAFAVHAVDYLLKPVGEKPLAAALDRVRAILAGQRRGEATEKVLHLLEHMESTRPRANRFVVRQGSAVQFVKAEDVEAIEAKGKTMRLHCGRRMYVIRESMTEIEKRLDPVRFVRTHRSWIVNIEKITEILTRHDRTFLLVLPGGNEVPVSRHYRASIEKLRNTPLVD